MARTWKRIQTSCHGSTRSCAKRKRQREEQRVEYKQAQPLISGFVENGRLSLLQFSNAKERKMFDRIARKMGRPTIAKGVKIVSVSVELDLLKQADAFAKRANLKRAELFTRALRGCLSLDRDPESSLLPYEVLPASVRS